MGGTYRNFDLTVTRPGDSYSAVAHTPESKTVGPVIFAKPFTSEELSGLRALRSGRFRDLGTAGSGPSVSPRDLGTRLFAAVFQGDVGRHWSTSQAAAGRTGQLLRLRLILLSADLQEWPWEYLWDRDFLTYRAQLSVVRCFPDPHSEPPPPRSWRLRVLVITSQPRGSQELCVDRELEALSRSLKSFRIFPWVSLKVLENADLARLTDELQRRPVDVLHFIGHGVYDREEDRGFLLFETPDGDERWVSGGALARLLQGQPRLALVVLNACESGRSSETDTVSGVAQKLADEGVRAVLAMQFPVADEAALVFSKTFYRSLFQGRELDWAVHEGRHRLFVEGFQAEAGNPVLYLQEEWKGISPWPKLAVVLLAAVLLVIGISLLPRHLFVRSDPGCPSPPGLRMPFAKVATGPGPPFCMARFEVTQQQWKALGLENPSRYKGRYLPVERVSFAEAEAFVARLNKRDPRGRYRLSTEAEWQHAYAAGETQDAEEVSRYGNCDRGDRFDKTAPVGSFEPNGLGIYDLAGNVSEWVSDVDLESGERVRMGGNFDNSPKNCASYRTHTAPERNDERIGLRIVADAVKP